MIQDQTKSPALRENDEPTAGNVPVPIWLVLVFGALFYSSQLYLSGHAGGFDQQVYAPFASTEEVAAANPKSEADIQIAMGKDIFSKTCAACHQPDGNGKEGTAPPLVGSEWVMAEGPNRIAHVVLNGLTGPITVKGKEWNLTMVPWRDVYNDEQLADVLTYVRTTLGGNKASAVKPQELTAARKDAHPGPMTAPELMSMPVK